MATATPLATEIAAERQPIIARARHLKAHRTRHQSASAAHLHIIMMPAAEGMLTMTRLADAIDVDEADTDDGDEADEADGDSDSDD